MQLREVESMAQLIDAIGAGCDPSDRGPVVVQATLWDGRIVQASYYKGDYKDANIDVDVDVIMDNELIRPHAEALVKDGTPIRVLTGSHDMVCFLEWKLVA